MSGTHSIHLRHTSANTCTLLNQNNNGHYHNGGDTNTMNKISGTNNVVNTSRVATFFRNASFMKWGTGDLMSLLRYHPLPCVLALCLFFFMSVEYTLRMIPFSSPPFDLGFFATVPFHRFLSHSPALNTILAALNTVFVFMQTSYILWTWLVEGRPRATIATLFMFTFRGILGYSTQLPLPQDFLGSGADFPVGNVSFFLFYSGHVAASVIASLDMRRMQRWESAWAFDTLNVLQFVRLLSTRGHYTIDLVVGVGAGILFDTIAANYLESKKLKSHSVSAAK